MNSLFKKLQFQAGALRARFSQTPQCPACQSKGFSRVDRKGFTTLCECRDCGLLHMYPKETEAAQAKFYQEDYSQPGLITDLPSDDELQRLMQTNFAGSSKDFAYHISIFEALGVPKAARMLDFGASWGYGAYQFRNAGYQTYAFELSKPRAEFGKKLGIEVLTEFSELPHDLDLVYSCHVLEHVPNPAETLRLQYDLLKPGGLIACHTPNGSRGWRERNKSGFNKAWGRVHPVLLNVDFVARLFPNEPIYVSSIDAPDVLRNWNQENRRIEACDQAGFFFVIRKRP